jgi:hypothetical protein
MGRRGEDAQFNVASEVQVSPVSLPGQMGGASGNPNDPDSMGADGMPAMPMQRPQARRVNIRDIPGLRARKYKLTGQSLVQASSREGLMLMEKSGGSSRQFRMRANKLLDERYFDIPFLVQQGVELVEVDEQGRPKVEEKKAS